MLQIPKTLNCKGTLIDLESPAVMGILNVTPDSFYDGGRYTQEKSILQKVGKMMEDGATFIDVGGQSSRPGATLIPETEELGRVLPVVELLVKEFPELLLSVDTFRSGVALKCVEAGAAMVNDISAGFLDPKMLDIVSKLKVPYCMMHMRGTPKTMQKMTEYEDVLTDILHYFSERMAKAISLGIRDVIIDPGFGFSKTLEQNYGLLKNLSLFHSLGAPILVGLSRKSMVYKALDVNSEQALNGTTALHMYALGKGVSILRVHDVKEAMECIALSKRLT